ncbi:MAG: AI-2E family transporter [Thermoanaerobaculia bacterium]
MLRTIAIVAAVWLALRLLWDVRAIVIVTFFGILFGILLAAAATRLERLHVPRALGATLVLAAILGGLVAAGAALAPTLQKQFREIREELPSLLDRAERSAGLPDGTIGAAVGEQTRRAARGGAAQAEQTRQAQQTREGLRRTVTDNLGELRRMLFPMAAATVNILTGFVVFLFIMLFYAIAPDFYFRGTLRLLPPRGRDEAADVMHAVAATLKQWVVARLIAMVIIGLVVGTALGLIGVRAAILLGVIAGVLELIPFFGPIVSAIPAIGMALLDSPQKAVIVLVLFIVVQQLEGNVLTPLLLENRAEVPPLLTIVMVPALTLVFGLLGALVAEPLLATALVLVRRLWVEGRLERKG